MRFLADSEGPTGLTIHGEAGVGKSTLLRAGIEHAAELGRRVLLTRPVQAEAEMAFAGLEQLLEDVIDEVLDELPTPQRVSLEVALLRAPAGPVGIEARTVASATATVLRALARRGPVVVAIDDLQWLDDASLRALRVAFGRLRDAPVLALAAARTSRRDLDLGFDRERLIELNLGGLSVEPLRALIRERLELSLSLPAGRRLAQLTGGNPYYALELATAQPNATDEGAETADLSELVARRLAPLPESARTALGTLAAAVHPTVDQLAAMIGDERVLDAAFAAGVLEEHGRELRFAHPLLAAAAYQALPPGRRRSIHRELARTSADPVERARHLAAAAVKPAPKTADDIDLGARAAAARGAPTVAADLFEQAARLTPASDYLAAAARRAASARELFAAGEGARALARSRALVDELPPGDLRAEVFTTMAFPGLTPIDESIAMCEQAVAGCESVDARARSLLVLSNIAQTKDLERGLQCARDALDVLEDSGDPKLRAVALGTLAAYQSYADPAGPGIELLREAWALQREHGSVAPDPYLEAATQLGLSLMWRDELDEARDLFIAQHVRASGAGQDMAASAIAMHLAELEIRAGQLEDARVYADESLALEDQGEDSQTLGMALYVRAHVAALQGEAELASSLATRGLAVGRAVGDGIFPMHNRWVLGQLELAQGNAAKAAEHLASLPGEREALGYLVPGSGPFTSDAVEALVAAGRIDEARAMNDAWEALGRELERPRLLATGARGRGLITAANGDPDTGANILSEALEFHEHLPVPHERARTLLALGATLRRAGRRRDARDVLEQAIASFEHLDQPLWKQRGRAELARLAGRKPADGDLTPTEWQVAELVAEGRSNQNVANTLFITVRTVEANLTRIYRKLDVHSRAELAARWKHIANDSGRSRIAGT